MPTLVSSLHAAGLIILALAGSTAPGARGAAVVPEIFAPGTISGPVHDTAPAFTPDGRTVYFSRSDGDTSLILVSHLAVRRGAEAWSEPVTAPFSGVWNDMEPAMSPDGRFLIFVSNRPATAGGKPLDGFFNGKAFPGRGGNLWRVTWSGTEWGSATRLPDAVNADPSTFAPAVAGDGSLYFMRPAVVSKRFELWRSRLAAGRYLPPEPLPFSDGSASDVDPAIDPGESFLVFGSTRPPAAGMDLFLVRKTAGRWDTPVHLGTTINTPGSDAESRLGPDRRTLYWASERLAAHEGEGPRPNWDNGKYNIWRVSLAAWLTR